MNLNHKKLICLLDIAGYRPGLKMLVLRTQVLDITLLLVKTLPSDMDEEGEGLNLGAHDPMCFI